MSAQENRCPNCRALASRSRPERCEYCGYAWPAAAVEGEAESAAPESFEGLTQHPRTLELLARELPPARGRRRLPLLLFFGLVVFLLGRELLRALEAGRGWQDTRVLVPAALVALSLALALQQLARDRRRARAPLERRLARLCAIDRAPLRVRAGARLPRGAQLQFELPSGERCRYRAAQQLVASLQIGRVGLLSTRADRLLDFELIEAS